MRSPALRRSSRGPPAAANLRRAGAARRSRVVRAVKYASRLSLRSRPAGTCSSSAILGGSVMGARARCIRAQRREMGHPTWYGAPLMSPPGKLGAGSAILAYVALWVGMVMIGGPAQFRGLVSGLWITEALAIALPAAFTLGVAGGRFLPWLGLRRPSWKHALIAAGVAAANQPVVSFLTWMAHAAFPRAGGEDFDAQQRLLDTAFRADAIPMLITVTLAGPPREGRCF